MKILNLALFFTLAASAVIGTDVDNSEKSKKNALDSENNARWGLRLISLPRITNYDPDQDWFLSSPEKHDDQEPQKVKRGGSSWGLIPIPRTGRSQLEKTWILDANAFDNHQSLKTKRSSGSWGLIPVPRTGRSQSDKTWSLPQLDHTNNFETPKRSGGSWGLIPVPRTGRSQWDKTWFINQDDLTDNFISPKRAGSSWGLIPVPRTGRSQTDKTWRLNHEDVIKNLETPKRVGGSWGLIPVPRTGRSQIDKTWLIPPQSYLGFNSETKRAGLIPFPRVGRSMSEDILQSRHFDIQDLDEANEISPIESPPHHHDTSETSEEHTDNQ